ncbi:hypothetical protein KCTC52924_00688 [Arenibacter antarcticus]|uniref:Alpha-ketoglutarate decarboxylase n=1 Tax=Arenibacter antarcticus TaxID=2040469 RepID=A0ABW5VG55_9FLAO|nr:alpha-ketoglutarate decarboxylase [Arenibacter sp. H213]MCM4169249.1 alpha-ketoglutarate decarboxylase [Arenibacter sp. H213]
MKTGYSLLKSPFLLLFFSLLTTISYSQGKPTTSDFWKRVQLGGGLGLGFGNNSFNASVSPSAIYRISNEFGMGMGLNLNYAKFNNAKLLAYGGSFLTFYNPIPVLQFSAELEQLRVNTRIELDGRNSENAYWSPALFTGIGYSMPNVTLGVRYNLLHDDQKSIYANALMPFIRVYF